MKRIWLWGAVLGASALLNGCTSDTDNDGSTPPPAHQEGYADPDGVILLNQGARMSENGSISYLAPDGTIEKDVYRTVNGSAFGNEAMDLDMCNGKIYIMSNNLYRPNNEAGDGCLVVADAETFRREKVFTADDLTFPRPEGSLEEQEMLPLSTPLENIAVMDEHNIFFSDSQGLFRLDGTTGELNIVKGSYAFGNQGATIETVIDTRGMAVIGDKLYCCGGGFWITPCLLEFSKGSNEVSRTLDLSHASDFSSGICQTGEHEILVATCGRSGDKKSVLFFIDTRTMTITREKQVNADISAEFMNTPGIALCGDYIYYAAGTLTVSRMSLKTWQTEEYIHVKEDAPNANYLTCNVIADAKKNLLYVSVSNELGESIVSDGNVLVYDCSGDEPRLVNNLVNPGSYPVNIYPMSRFY